MDLISSISELKDLRGELKDVERRIRELTKAKEAAGNRELQESLQERIDYSAERKRQIYSLLTEFQQIVDDADITSKERRVLTLYYIDGLSWQQVAFRMGEHDEQVPRRIRNRLLRKKRNKNKS